MGKLFKKPSDLENNIDHKKNELKILSGDELIKKYSNKYDSNLLFLFDATGSMENIWGFTSKILLELINRLNEFGSFSTRWIAYRDYIDGSDIIETSSWTQNIELMKNFIKTIECKGGGGNNGEAVEKALETAVEDQKATRIILIGDEPPLSQADCIKHATKLGERGIPVYSFAVKYLGSYDDRTIYSFKEIAKLSGGEFTVLKNVNDLIDLIALTITEDIGGKTYIKKYLDKYSSSKQITSGGKDFAKKLLNKKNPK